MKNLTVKSLDKLSEIERLRYLTSKQFEHLEQEQIALHNNRNVNICKASEEISNIIANVQSQINAVLLGYDLTDMDVKITIKDSDVNTYLDLNALSLVNKSHGRVLYPAMHKPII